MRMKGVEKKLTGKKAVKKKMLQTALVCMLGMGWLSGGCGSGMDTKSENSSIRMDDSMNGAGSAYDQMGDSKEQGWDSADAGTEDAMEQETADMDDGALQAEGSSIQHQKEKLIYTYRYSVETKEFDDFLVDIMAEVETLGGYVENSETNGSAADGMNRYASMTLRIPVDQTDQMLTVIKETSNVVYDNVSRDNVTLRYVDMESHIKALRTEQKTLLRLIEKADKIEDVIALQSQLTQVRYEIESYESQLREMDNLVEYSTVYLDISEVERTTTANKKVSFGEEISNRFSDNLYALGQWIRSFVIGLIGSLPILIPLGLLLAAGVYVLRKWIKRRKIRRQQEDKTIPGSYRSIYQGKGRPQKTEVRRQEEEVHKPEEEVNRQEEEVRKTDINKE